MKIIKKGNIPPKWWVGRRATCGHCHTEVELDESDGRDYEPTEDPLRIDCPVCDLPLVVSRYKFWQKVDPPIIPYNEA